MTLGTGSPPSGLLGGDAIQRTASPVQQLVYTYRIRNATLDDAPALADCVIEPIVATFRGLVPDQCLAWLTREQSITNWQRWFRGGKRKGSFLHVGETLLGQVAGCALAGPRPDHTEFEAELFLLGVLPEYQGQGIGRQLVASVARRLSGMGLTSMGVGVLSVNPNRRFYELLGAHFLREEPYDWNGVVLAESFYVWPDITSLSHAIIAL